VSRDLASCRQWLPLGVGPVATKLYSRRFEVPRSDVICRVDFDEEECSGHDESRRAHPIIVRDEIEKEMEKVGMVDCGLMGSGIAEVCAGAGLGVVVVEINDVAVKSGRARLEKSIARVVSSEPRTWIRWQPLGETR